VPRRRRRRRRKKARADRRRIPSTAPTIPPIRPDLFVLFETASPDDGALVGSMLALESDGDVVAVEEVPAADDVAEA
jgi:hypothetical protein